MVKKPLLKRKLTKNDKPKEQRRETEPEPQDEEVSNSQYNY